MPKQFDKRIVAVLFGGLDTAGGEFDLKLLSPIDPADPKAEATMGLGITFGCQIECGNSSELQYNEVTVNGTLLTSSAGGEDDGKKNKGKVLPKGIVPNGALITVGGIGDKPANPPNPAALPTAKRDDDELYDLLDFIDPATTDIKLTTKNPSEDDNIVMAWFQLSGKARFP